LNFRQTKSVHPGKPRKKYQQSLAAAPAVWPAKKSAIRDARIPPSQNRRRNICGK